MLFGGDADNRLLNTVFGYVVLVDDDFRRRVADFFGVLPYEFRAERQKIHELVEFVVEDNEIVEQLFVARVDERFRRDDADPADRGDDAVDFGMTRLKFFDRAVDENIDMRPMICDQFFFDFDSVFFERLQVSLQALF